MWPNALLTCLPGCLPMQGTKERMREELASGLLHRYLTQLEVRVPYMPTDGSLTECLTASVVGSR